MSNEWSKAVTSNQSKVKIDDQSKNELLKRENDYDPLQFMKEAKRGIGIMQRLQLDWRESKAMAQAVEDIAVSLLNKQREAIDYQMMVDLDKEKKGIFKNYLADVGKVEHGIIATTEESKKDLIKFMKEGLIEMMKTKKNDLDLIKTLKDDGEILSGDMEYLEETISTWTNQSALNLQQKISMLLEQHADSYKATLKLLKQKIENV